ncbi:MAG: response regulator [Aeromicrobium sp.]
MDAAAVPLEAQGEVRVLVVDDQEPYRCAMQAVVEATAGFVVVGSASSGEESVAMADELRPELVLMDVNLPGIDGIEATRRILAHDTDTVVILLSTYDREDVDLAGAGASDYVPKADLGPGRLLEVWTSARADG